MSKLVKVLGIAALTLSFVSIGMASDLSRTSRKEVSAEYQIFNEPVTSIQHTTTPSQPLPQKYTLESADATVEVTMVDSSLNGYGLVVGDTKPIIYTPDAGIGMAYRQWQGESASSGYIGMAYLATLSNTWQSFANLNSLSPGQGAGRYPSIMGSGEFPWVLWNETGDNTGGGGEFGGRPLYSYDEFGWGGGSFASPVDFNQTPGDPADLWVGSPSYVQDGSGTDHFNVTFSTWTGLRNVFHFNATGNDFGYVEFSTPDTLFKGRHFEGDADNNYTSDASISFNSSGVGYSALTTYFSGYSPDSSHTVMIRKSTDFGETWNSSGMNGTDYYYIPDQQLHDLLVDGGFMSDTLIFAGDPNDTVRVGLFLGYDNHVRVDEGGTLHFFTNAVYSGTDGVYIGADGVGFYHFWTNDPSDPGSWQVSKITDMGKTYVFSHGETSNWQRMFTNSAISNNNQNIVYNAYTAFVDTTEANRYYEVLVERSFDGGITWQDTVNVTDLPGENFDAIDAHMAPIATDSTCYIMYQVPDYSLATVTPVEVPEDYKNRVYYAKVTFSNTPTGIEAGDAELPAQFILDQNYPNPFNPTTVIQYSLDKTAQVDLTVYNALGQQVRVLEHAVQSAGNHSVTLDGSKLSAGVYFYRLTVGANSQVRKMILMK